MNNKELAEKIIENVGGEANINNVSHCATRLRFNLRNDDLALTEKLRQTNDVISIVEKGGQYQIVLGPKVESVYEEVRGLLGQSDAREQSEGESKTNIFTVISGIFAPILPAFAGSGILRALVILASQFGLLSETSGTYQILTIASMSVFYFLPILLAYTTARYFNVSVMIAMVIGASLINPDLIAMMGDVGPGAVTDFFGIPVVLMNYPSTVLPIILAVWGYSYLEKFLRRTIPEGGHLVFVPLFSLAIMVPLTLIVVGPISVTLSNWIAGLINFLIESSPLLAGALVGGGWNALVSVGLHWAVNPIMIQNVAQQGYDYIIPFTFATNFAMLGAAIGVWLKARNPEFKKYSLTTALTIMFSGITEPAIYGVAIPTKRPFVAAVIGGSIGGAYLGAMGVTSQAFVFGGLTTLPAFAGGTGNNLMHAIIGLAICVVVSSSLTYFFGFEIPAEYEKTTK